MDRNNIIPTLYNIVIIVASLAILMRYFPKIMGLLVFVLFIFYLTKVWGAR